MIRNLQVLAIALVVSSASLVFGQDKEVDDVQVGKSVIGSDGSTKAGAPAAAKAKMKPGKEKKVYVGKSHEAGKKPADMKKEKKRGGFLARILGRDKNSAGEDNPKRSNFFSTLILKK